MRCHQSIALSFAGAAEGEGLRVPVDFGCQSGLAHILATVVGCDGEIE